LSMAILIGVGIFMTVLLHFAGVYTKSLKIAWAAILFLWAVAMGTLMNEIKPQGYAEIKAMQGKYKDTDALIEQAGKKISFYELMQIKENYMKHKKEEEDQ